MPDSFPEITASAHALRHACTGALLGLTGAGRLTLDALDVSGGDSLVVAVGMVGLTVAGATLVGLHLDDALATLAELRATRRGAVRRAPAEAGPLQRPESFELS